MIYLSITGILRILDVVRDKIFIALELFGFVKKKYMLVMSILIKIKIAKEFQDHFP